MDISTLQSNLDFIKSLYFHEEWKDEDCKNEILEAIKECNTKIEEAFGSSMHRLHKHMPSFEAVEKVVKKFPSTLSYQDEKERLPIQTAVDEDNLVEYVPVLAKEGFKDKVGGEDARGGLLSHHPSDNDDDWNTLQMICNVFADEDENIEMFDKRSLNVLKELRKSGLLRKKDICEQQLLYYACAKFSIERLRYLVDWDPDALLKTRVGIHPWIHETGKEDFHLALEMGFRYHPSIGGLLFIKDEEGITALEDAFDTIGEKETIDMLHTLLSPNRDFPILHHIFTKTPQYKDLFAKIFPWAYHLKDHNGRSFHQAILVAGPDVMNANDLLFASLSDNQIQEKDPNTTLYPFAAMAVGEHADLEKSFYLLRRHPSVLERRQRATESRRSSSRRGKRKAEELESSQD